MKSNSWYRVSILIVILSLLTILIYGICTPIFAYGEDDSIEVCVLMYHNIVEDGTHSSKYEIMESDLESDLVFLRDNGYKVVSPMELEDYVEGRVKLPRKCVMLTFDDGYYSYVTRLVPLLQKYEMQAVANVVGEYTVYNKNNPKTSPRYRYLDYEDITELDKSGVVTIGLHSYAQHHIKDGRSGVGQKKGESDEDYARFLEKDTLHLMNKLADIDIASHIYAYPYGSYSRCSDRVLARLGITMTLSCNEGVNRLSRGSSLYLLKRYNRDGNAKDLAQICPYFKNSAR